MCCVVVVVESLELVQRHQQMKLALIDEILVAVHAMVLAFAQMEML